MSKKKSKKKDKPLQKEEVEKHPSQKQIKSIPPKYLSIPSLLFLVASIIVIMWQRLIPLLVTEAIPRISKTPFLWDPDTCYHVRRILYIAQHTMKFPFYDPLLAYPHGAVPVWSPFYDWILALPSFIISWGNPSDNLVVYSALILNLAFVLAQLLFVGLLIHRATKKYRNFYIVCIPDWCIRSPGQKRKLGNFRS